MKRYYLPLICFAAACGQQTETVETAQRTWDRNAESFKRDQKLLPTILMLWQQTPLYIDLDRHSRMGNEVRYILVPHTPESRLENNDVDC
jgi:hypothetical protein